MLSKYIPRKYKLNKELSVIPMKSETKSMNKKTHLS